METLNLQKIYAAIEPENIKMISSIEICSTIDSTNSYLLKEAKKGVPSGTICLAEEQEKGYGRLGRQWQSFAGNIACSFLWRFTLSKDISGLSIAIAVMIINVLKKYGVMHNLQLKWPNDILFANRKLAGILLEIDKNAIVIGIGLNLKLPSQIPAWIDLHEITGNEVRRNYLAGLLINELLMGLSLYENRGLAPFLNEWRKHDVLKQKTIIVQTPQQQFVGIAQGISETGELIVKDEFGNERQFCYGEVSIR